MIEALAAESVLPIAATGSFGHYQGFGFMKMVRRKVAWLWTNAERLTTSLVPTAQGAIGSERGSVPTPGQSAKARRTRHLNTGPQPALKQGEDAVFHPAPVGSTSESTLLGRLGDSFTCHIGPNECLVLRFQSFQFRPNPRYLVLRGDILIRIRMVIDRGSGFLKRDGPPSLHKPIPGAPRYLTDECADNFWLVTTKLWGGPESIQYLTPQFIRGQCRPSPGEPHGNHVDELPHLLREVFPPFSCTSRAVHDRSTVTLGGSEYASCSYSRTP